MTNKTKSKKQQKLFMLEPETILFIKKLAYEQDLTQSEVLERLVKQSRSNETQKDNRQMGLV